MIAFTTAAAGSSTGLVRSINEDSAYAGQWLYAVADGMGGHVAGEVASATVIATLSAYDAEADPGCLADILGNAFTAANIAIRQRTEEDPALRTMGTTLTAMLWSGHTFALAHIGDSRAYLLRDGKLRQLTEDHALHNLVASPGTSPVMAQILTRFLDGRPDRSSPDLGLRQALPGDRYLLCTDGLSGVVPDETIREVLGSGDDDLARTAERLTRLANSAGGPDNITAIVVDALASGSTARRRLPMMLGAAHASI